LSAGEKQIYAIAILEALAKTSGRKLPIIIDTPLGRLDSKHRRKLVENYFPTASHQVIILSTDTEIDESFHKSLSDHISHTIKLDYDESIASTITNEGYFWPTAKAV
jgi:DNA sulfur modification protein DndD